MAKIQTTKVNFYLFFFRCILLFRIHESNQGYAAPSLTWVISMPVRGVVTGHDLRQRTVNPEDLPAIHAELWVGPAVKPISSARDRRSWCTSRGDCGGEFIISFTYCSWSEGAKEKKEKKREERTCSYAGNWLVMEKNVFCRGSCSRSGIITASHCIHYGAHFGARVNISYHVFYKHIKAWVSWCAVPCLHCESNVKKRWRWRWGLRIVLICRWISLRLGILPQQ